jgi:ABC-type molybdate transport system substrate-binding protein
MARVSQILGAAFERRVEHRATLPIWVKVPTAHKRAGSTWLDYVGATSRGRFVTADAKWCPSGKVTKSVLSKAQQLHADKALAANALVYVLAGMMVRDELLVALVPWRTLRERSVALADFVAVDWCAAIEADDEQKFAQS